MVGVFINYRNDQDAFAAALVDQRLTTEFGADQVFRDSRTLLPGMDFPPELWRRLTLSTVVVALIGPRWLTAADGSGRRRLDDPKDYVRREIGEALDHGITVMPVLLDGAARPREEQLPDDIKRLATRQSLAICPRNDDPGLQRLVDELTRLIPKSAASWRAAQRLLAEGCYAQAITHLNQALAGPNVEPAHHYYLALALLGNRPPRHHTDISEIVTHLDRASELLQARLLRLVVDEDHRPNRCRGTGLDPKVAFLVEQLSSDNAQEITRQFHARSSATWRALADHARQGPTPA